MDHDAHSWHTLDVEDAVAAIEADADKGLSSPEVRVRLARHGPNALPETRRRSLLSVFVAQFKSPLIYLLFGAGGIALVMGHVSDAAVISIVVLLNAVIGAVQEGRAERSLEALRKLATVQARVVRDGVDALVEARQLVPGDVLLLDAGDAVVADARLLHCASLTVAEAALTGESIPVAKALAPVDAETPLGDRRNMVYAGTHVTAGRARAVVVATGSATEVGQLARLAKEAEEPETPLEYRIRTFGRYIIVAAFAMFALVNVVGFVRGVPFDDIVMVGISQVVGMVPEGLPVAMTIALAVGVRRMARRRAVVRRLAAVETLGSTTIICTDKTGTLTRNEMTVTTLVLPDGRELSVSGSGYEPAGDIVEGGVRVDPARVAGLPGLLEAVVLCNDAQLHEPDDTTPRWQPIGDPTEVALLTLARKGGIVPGQTLMRFPRRAELSFDATAKMMATQHDSDAGPVVVIKGAPEQVLALCSSFCNGAEDASLDDSNRAELRAEAEKMAMQALRVLAVAVVRSAEIDSEAGFDAFRARATWLGLIGQIDPPRPEVRDAVEHCRRAGIRPVMVTGDHKATGYAIARSLGIARDGDLAVDGSELERMSDAELAGRVDAISVYARVHPAQKLRIVEAHQKRHEVVAMTGDGVNDAPALVKADVGVAMGLTGTEVAKESAEIVIGDDNFASIVAAVEEGRVVYQNIKKVILYLFSTSMAEVSILLLALLAGYPPPLAAVQILWINLVTEATVTVNLIMEPAEGDEMQRKPISPDEPLLTRVLLSRMVFMVPAMTVSTLGWFMVRLSEGVDFAQVQTETFTVLAVCQWFNVLNCRSKSKSALTFGLMRNVWLIGGLLAGNLLQIAVVFFRPLGTVFHTVPFDLDVVLVIGAVASLVLWVEEIRKWVVRASRRRIARTAGA